MTLDLAACTTWTRSGMAKRDDYLDAMLLHAGGREAEALAAFPDKEPGGFLTTLERGWLATLSGRADPDAMVPVGRDLEARTTLSVTREAASYFYKEMEDGYYPAEHEAIAFHIVSGFAFAQAGRRAEALVEARKAAFYLQSDFGTSAPDFDDAALRLWLAALWAYGGEWDKARVDLRRAAALERQGHAAVATLAAREAPPATLSLVLTGPGPDLRWDPALLQDGALAVDALRFEPGAAAQAQSSHSVPTVAWYRRHQQRDHAIRQVLSTSRYMMEGIAPAGLAGATMTLGIASGVVLMAAGVGGGAAVIFYGLKAVAGAPSYVGGLVIGTGALLATAGIVTGLEVIDSAQSMSARLLDRGFNPTNDYRYARFLPDHVRLEAHAELLARDAPLRANAGAGEPPHLPRLALDAPDGRTRVLVYYVPGSRSEMRRAALRATWTDEAHRKVWALLPVPASGKDAADACSELSQADQDHRTWRLPTWTEVLDARQSGLADPAVARGIAGRLRFATGGLWSRSPAADGRWVDGCRFVDLRDFSEATVKDCGVPRGVACVAGTGR